MGYTTLKKKEVPPRRRKQDNKGLRMIPVLLASAMILYLNFILVDIRTTAALAATRAAMPKSSSTEWVNDFNVVHVLHTRFLQHQPYFLYLGRARLKMFKAFCLASITSQTTQQFLWIIRTDPKLHLELKTLLLELVQDVPNIIVLASNQYPDGFRSLPDLMKSDLEKKVWSGSIPLLRSYHAAAQSRVVLESRLDADDGLVVDYMQTMQREAHQALIRPFDNNNNNKYNTNDPSKVSSRTKKVWRVWCVDNLVEWQPYSPWTEHSTKRKKKGALVVIPDESICITAGMTWAYHVKAKPSDRIVTAHNKVRSSLPACRTTSPKDITLPQEPVEPLYAEYNCVSRIPIMAAIRARTPMSSGMKNVVLDMGMDDDYKKKRPGDSSPWKDKQDELWQEIPEKFGIEAKDIFDVRAYMQGNLRNIVGEALDGQCRGVPGTCKDEGIKTLLNLFESISY